MKSTTRVILLTLGVVAVVGYYVVMSVVPRETVVDNRECTAIEVVVTDSAERHYMTAQAVLTYLDGLHLNPVGRRVNQIPLQAIEDTLTAHPFIAAADCYMSARGTMHVLISQRIPLVEIHAPGHHYYVATDRLPMPVDTSVHASVLQVGGAVSEQMACTDVAGFAEWLQADPYWQSRVLGLRVEPNHESILFVEGDSARILLGELVDYDRKMHRLETFFENGYRRLAHKPYRELDLRFDGQVIGR